MDVLIITLLYPPHSYGGYETSCRDVVERWRRAGHRVTVLTSDLRLAGVADDPDEQGVRRELRPYWVDHAFPRHGLGQRMRLERANAAALEAALEATRPTVVSAWAMGGLSLGLLTTVVERGLPLVLVLLDDWLLYGEQVDAWRRPVAGRPRLARALSTATGLPTTWPPADRVRAVYCSEAVRDAAASARWRPSRSNVAGTGVDHEDFPVPPEPDRRPWSWRLLQVGRLDQRKGLDDSVRCLSHLPEQARLDVVGRGDDDYLRRLRDLVAQHALQERVRFRGAVPRHDLRDVYGAADVALFPVVWQEPFGIVPLEAMACATPVVATGTGGSATFLRDGTNCLLVPPQDPVALAAAVRRLAADAGLRERLVRAGLETARAHGVDAYAERLEAAHLAAAGR